MTLQTLLLVLHVLLALALIGVILMQQGKGASMGAAFGSGASSTVFGARGSANFLSRATAILAIVFFSNSFLLSYLSSREVGPASLMERVEQPATGAPGVPAAPSDTGTVPTVPADGAADTATVPVTPPVPQTPGDAPAPAGVPQVPTD